MRPRSSARRSRRSTRDGSGATRRRTSPWAWKPSTLVAVRAVRIEIDHTRRRQWLRIRDQVSVRIRDAWAGDETVTCVISGHDRSGEELVADELVIEDGPFGVSFRGSCGYSATFDYAG